MTKYYDPEYDRIVNEDEIREQYAWFNSHDWFHKSYEQFREENFEVIEEEEPMKVITSKEIRRAFTEKVNEYLAQGMDFSIRTMSGSQGEISKVDLTDGKYIYRVRLERGDFYADEEFFYNSCETVELIVERFEDDGRNDFDTWGTLWSGKGELIEEHKWYSLDRDKKAFVESREEIERVFKVRNERRECRKVIHQEITDDRRIALVHKMVKKHKGYASVNKKAIEKVVREGGYNFRVFFTAESKKGSLRI